LGCAETERILEFSVHPVGVREMGPGVVEALEAGVGVGQHPMGEGLGPAVPEAAYRGQRDRQDTHPFLGGAGSL
jgi:hypothetical protein